MTLISLCRACSKANKCCPIYPINTTRCVEYKVKK